MEKLAPTSPPGLVNLDTKANSFMTLVKYYSLKNIIKLVSNWLKMGVNIPLELDEFSRRYLGLQVYDDPNNGI